MRILYSMLHPGFIRHFDRTLDLLADQGHHICLVFHGAKIEPGQWLRQFSARPNVTLVARGPDRKDKWSPFLNYIRALSDYSLYFRPEFQEANTLRRDAAVKIKNEHARRAVERLKKLPGVLPVLDSFLPFLERCAPPDPKTVKFIRAMDPDLLLVTPPVQFRSKQVDYVKAARCLGIPTGLCVASWDNLTNKGLMREVPDRIFVWNKAQLREAVDFHGANPKCVTVTGAQSFDQWFEASPAASREAFLARLNLTGPLVLYACSAARIAPNEIDAIVPWAQAVREQGDPQLKAAAILVRPHPVNPQPWDKLLSLGLPNIAIWGEDEIQSFEADGRRNYFDSLYYSAVVVGLNTSAQIEAALVGRAVFCFLDPSIPETLRGTLGTLHFNHLLEANGGPLHVSHSLAEHVDQLGKALSDPAMAERSRRFTQSFIRPLGLDRAAAPILAEAIVQLGGNHRQSCAGILKPGPFGRRFLLGGLAGKKAKPARSAGTARENGQ